MATQTIENFNTLDLETLASVEGGGCSWRGAGGATVQGAIGGAFGGNVVLPVVGSVHGYLAGGVLGGAGGTVAYGATCWWS
ncbi:MAG: Blp family class II bacteriocin [Streptococcus sp.]|uniref:Blp family class II bacteriocin n=1 Tax=Streptococcus sp. TaxID=1306 RepID=UPI0039934844